MKPRRIVCAAMRSGDIIIASPRHWDTVCRSTLSSMPNSLRYDKESRWEQGFVDTWGTFLTREEAWTVAWQNRQIVRMSGDQDHCIDPYLERDPTPPPGVKLYSENLY